MLNNKILEGNNNSEHLLELMDQIESMQNKDVEHLFQIHLEITICNGNLNF